MTRKHHIVNISGGIPSWLAGKRAVAKYSVDDVQLVFADTLLEDEDLYRFLIAGAANIYGLPRKETADLEARALALPACEDALEGAEDWRQVFKNLEPRKTALADLRRDTAARVPGLVWIAEGRHVWEIFFDEKFLANSRLDPCSRILKRTLLDGRTAGYRPEETTKHVGLDWTEQHRVERFAKNVAPFKVESLLCETPLLMKSSIFELASAEGIEPPRLYAMGFPHNNCGGFCVKAGQGHFTKLYHNMPRRYAFHEFLVQEIRDYIGKPVSMLQERRGGVDYPLTLRTLRKRIEAKEKIDMFDFGGCGCALE